MLYSPEILRVLVEAGADTAEVDFFGRNGLIKAVLGSSFPSTSAEFEALQYLLTVSDDIFARDACGNNIFHLVHWYPYHRPNRVGSYLEDLLYCALYRSGLALRVPIPPPLGPPVFNSQYTVQHYRALLYLDTWDINPWHWDIRYSPLLNSDDISQREREGALSLGEWVPLHLLMMEERVSRAIYEADDDDDKESEEDDEDQDDGEGDDEDEDEDDFPRAHG